MIQPGSLRKPLGGFCCVGCDTATFAIQDAKRIHGIGVARRSGLFEQLRGPGKIRRLALAFHRHDAQIVKRSSMSLRCGRLEQDRAPLEVQRHAFGLNVHQAQRECRLAIVVVGGEAIPSCRFRKIAPNPKAIMIEQAHQSHRCRIA